MWKKKTERALAGDNGQYKAGKEIMLESFEKYFVMDFCSGTLMWSKSATESFAGKACEQDAVTAFYPDDYTALCREVEKQIENWSQYFHIKVDEERYIRLFMNVYAIYRPDRTILFGITPPDNQRSDFDNELLRCLNDSVVNDFKGFEMYYQPIVFSENGNLYGCEALLRWNSSELAETVSTQRVIQELENEGLIYEVGKWTLSTAVRQCAEWCRSIPDFQMSINVTAGQFEDIEFRHFVMEQLNLYHVKPSSITLELTESNQINNTEELGKAFDFFRRQGMKIALDDFGTGYDSLSIFRVLSADELKIDRSFIERLSYNVADQKLIKQIIDLCDSLKMFVCVEGIETKESEQIIRDFGARLCQGFYYDVPLCSADFLNRYINVEESVKSCQSCETLSYAEQSMVYDTIRPSQALNIADVVECAYAGIFQVGLDYEFTFLSCNEGYRRMLGYTAKEIEERFKNHALSFVHPDDLEYVNSEIRRQLGYGDTVTIEFRIIRSDGASVWILGTGNIVKTNHGMSSLVVVIIENDGNKKKALRMEKEYKLHKKILSYLPMGIKCVRYDEKFTIEYFSPGYLSILGYSKEELQTLFDGKYINMIYEEDREMVLNDVLEQIKVSHVVHLRYRSYCKAGGPIWLETISRLAEPDESGIQKCYSSVVDVTNSIDAVEKKHTISLANCYQAAIQWWGEILFEFNVENETITYSENFAAMFGRVPQSSLYDELLFIHPEDRDIFEAAFLDFHEGRELNYLEMRVRKKDGNYIWCSFLFNKPNYIGDTPVSIIGKICDITQKKKEKELLLIKPRQDQLTGLLNKGTMEKKIRKVLQSGKSVRKFAFWMLDIDHFKCVNDTYGHVFGDALLRETAGRLSNCFTSRTITGRAGGDEFIVFMEYDGRLKTLEEKIKKVLEILRLPFTYHKQSYTNEINIGVSRYPEDSMDFYELFHCADSALYQVKDGGKNGYCVFHLTEVKNA